MLIENGFKVLDSIQNADIDAEHYCFYLYKYEGKSHCVRQPFIPTIFEYNNGILNRVSVVNNEVCREEIIYVHFQKRKVEVLLTNNNTYYLVPNKIVDADELSPEYVIKNSKDRLTYLIAHRLDRIKRAIKIRLKQS